ncbi:thiC family protein [Clostridioides difficile DA00165]|nr:thiC family protein [Clostridioides difficile DA00165]
MPNHERLTHIVSRGGSLLFAWMELNNKEILFILMIILDICEEYDVTLSLGDACRPGCIKILLMVFKFKNL